MLTSRVYEQGAAFIKAHLRLRRYQRRRRHEGEAATGERGA